jgi:hypothetical protein
MTISRAAFHYTRRHSAECRRAKCRDAKTKTNLAFKVCYPISMSNQSKAHS